MFRMMINRRRVLQYGPVVATAVTGVVLSGSAWLGWTILAKLVPADVVSVAQYGAWLLLSLGLLITAAATGYVRESRRNARCLRAANAELDRAVRALNAQNARFDAALNNMSHGLIMFSADEEIVVCNDRFIQMYDLSREVIKPGFTLIELLRHRKRSGHVAGDPEEHREEILARRSRGHLAKWILEEANGREVLVTTDVMANGGWVSTHEDITERRAAEAKITHMAMHDALTDLPNRLFFREQLEKRLATLDRDQKFAVLCLDLDRFKNVNDNLGHPLGDKLLRKVGERLRSCLREKDTIARLGGDEFAIIQGGVDLPSDATALAARLTEVIKAPFDLDGHQVVAGVGIGISIAPSDGSDPDQLLKNAEMALHRAKADGQGTYRFFEPAMDARMRERRALEQDLRKALVNGEFEVYYQPIVNLEHDEICGFEALLRWHHPERGLVSPGEFIALAEETAQIVSIGEWVLHQACGEAAKWPNRIRVAVNVSPVQFKRTHLVEVVMNALARAGLPAQRLELEITEAAVLMPSESILATLHQLRDLGVCISMDDFGTGYSSLSYLRTFPFDKIKIDQSFVRNIPSNPESMAIVRAVTRMGASLNIATTGEGVETLEELDFLKRKGCTEAQGYLFSKPKPAREVGAMLAEQAARTRVVA
jgi:diguanylate cyclase (GGDEF)-like protein